MTRWRYLIPLGILIAGLMTAGSIRSYRFHAARRMIDDAARSNRPILLAFNQSGPDDRYRLASIDHPPVDLITRDMTETPFWLFFTEDGTARFVEWFPGLAGYQAWEIVLPEIHVREVSIPWDTWGRSAQGVQRFYESGGERLIRLSGSDTFRIYDPSTDMYQELDFETRPSWLEEVSFRGYLRQYELSPDGTAVILYTLNQLNHQVLSRFEIAEQEWSMVIEIEGLRSFNAGPGGNVIGLNLDRVGPNETIFIDRDGNPLHTIWGMECSIIGDRWIACKESSSDGGIVLIDMEDDWQERRLQVFPDGEVDFIMHEPSAGSRR